MLEALKMSVLKANQNLPKHQLVVLTWGNVSGIDREKNLIVIKPSGVSYEDLTIEDLPVLDLDGNQIEGRLKPSSDTKTHLMLYKAFPGIGGIVHTHSPWSTIWAQSGLNVPALGTTHADYFNGDIPCTRKMSASEVKNDYEANTGKVIIETFKGHDPMEMPGVLVYNHGPFCWGKTPEKAVEHALVMEEVSKMAYHTLSLNPSTGAIDSLLLHKHFYRKHGDGSYYGQ